MVRFSSGVVPQAMDDKTGTAQFVFLNLSFPAFVEMEMNTVQNKTELYCLVEMEL